MSEPVATGGVLDLGEILLRTTQLTEEQLNDARKAQSESGGRLVDHLLQPQLPCPPHSPRPPIPRTPPSRHVRG